MRDEDSVISCGLLIASFMNFGGYHSFGETFPIVQAFAKGEKFAVEVAKSAEELYREITEKAEKFVSTETFNQVESFKNAYEESFVRVKTPKLKSTISLVNALNLFGNLATENRR